jgi:hypothetical protein
MVVCVALNGVTFGFRSIATRFGVSVNTKWDKHLRSWGTLETTLWSGIA